MATTYNEAVEQTIIAGEQLHQIINGDAVTEVAVEDGSKIPSIRKALIDNFYFKDPIDWQVGQTETIFNQLRKFTDGTLWYARTATSSNPVMMGTTPLGDTLWVLYSEDAIIKLTPQIRESLRRSYAEAGYNLREYPESLETGGVLLSSVDVIVSELTGKAYSGSGPFPQTIAEGTDPSGGGFTDRSGELLSNLVKKQTNKQTINVSAFGNTGTISAGSNEAWEAALAFARAMAPSYTNNINQSWPDMSGFELVADTPLYLNEPLKWRHVYGATVAINFIAADNWGPTRDSFMLDTTLPVSGNNSFNRLPYFTKWLGSFNCRYKANGIYINDFLHFVFSGKIINYWQYGIRTGTSGNELIITPEAIISQWTYTADNALDLPPDVLSGTGIYVNCGDCVILGIVAYYQTVGIRVNGRSCYLGAGCHIYGDRKQALQQDSGGGNLLLDGVWFDASRVTLHSEAQIRNCRVFLSSGDSNIGINIPTSGDEISIKGCIFLGISSGTTAVFRSPQALANRSCIVSGNEYWDGITNSDISNISPGVKGTVTAGTTVITSALGKYTRDSSRVYFDMDVNWSSATGTGSLVVTGLPFINTTGYPIPVSVTVSTSSLSTVTSAYVPNNASDILFKAGNSLVAIPNNGSVSISGSMRLL